MQVMISKEPLLQVWAQRHNPRIVMLQVRPALVDPPTEFDEVLDDYDGGWQQQQRWETDTPEAEREYQHIMQLLGSAQQVTPKSYDFYRTKLAELGYSAEVLDTVRYLGVSKERE